MRYLYISVIEVDGLPETASFWSSTDPYCRIKCGTEQGSTSVKKRAGGRAIFHESFNFPMRATDLEIEILDKATLSSDKVLANGVVTIRARDGYCFMGPIPLRDASGDGLNPNVTLAISVHDQ
ncbi:C2 domain protein [Gregarina niphandrodes]|uniref:C2 domain protein n=1 Tax=Gregarina niphandrodes TaxID=110365 RepID=A0A023B7G8_GRENI|nr:C2 domain protein [Gregarina niphandrodes]EZG67217.1 C2 domain protein [Gregarina niphandrodes]|eukprot:XP_011130306.1 C2 domain protein [Gregarina niphandrodes]